MCYIHCVTASPADIMYCVRSYVDYSIYRHMNLKTLLAARRKKLQDSRKLQQFLRDVHEVSKQIDFCVACIYVL